MLYNKHIEKRKKDGKMKKLCMLSAFASFMTLLASAGASDLTLISVGQLLVRVVFCLFAIAVSLFGIKYFTWKNIRQHKIIAGKKSEQISSAEYRQVA
jgi:hypothetical protein